MKKDETKIYWKKVKNANDNLHELPELKVAIDVFANYYTLNDAAFKLLNEIDKLFEENSNSLMNLKRCEIMTTLHCLLKQMQLKYLEHDTTLDPFGCNDEKLKEERAYFLEGVAKTFVLR